MVEYRELSTHLARDGFKKLDFGAIVFEWLKDRQTHRVTIEGTFP